MSLAERGGEWKGQSAVGLRRRLVLVALLAWGLGTLHLVDHAIRGELVTLHGLTPVWDHSGWPFQPDVTPFTFSALLVQLLLLGGVVLTRRGRLWAGYWLATGAALAAVVTVVHLVPGHETETPAVIFAPYVQVLSAPWGRVVGGLAVGVTVAIEGVVLLIVWSAIRVRRLSGRW